MAEHLARRMDLDPIMLLTGLMSLDQWETVLLLIETIQEAAELPRDKRLRFAELFLEFV